MKIDSKELIVGIPSLKLRDFFKTSDVFNAEMMGSNFSLTDEEAAGKLNTLVDLGFLKKESEYYTFTIKGKAFRMAKAVSPLKKEKATQIFEEFLKRVEEVNNNDYYLYKVDKVLLFGSFITDSITVNDIDIAIDIQHKYPAKRMEMDEVRSDVASEKGVRFSNYLERLFYPQREVEKFLKSKQRYLSFHSMEDGILKTTKVKQVYPKL